MKIETQITVVITRADGTTTTLGRSVSKQAGDNPNFERNETAIAVQDAATEFVPANNLAGTRPL